MWKNSPHSVKKLVLTPYFHLTSQSHFVHWNSKVQSVVLERQINFGTLSNMLYKCCNVSTLFLNVLVMPTHIPILV